MATQVIFFILVQSFFIFSSILETRHVKWCSGCVPSKCHNTPHPAMGTSCPEHLDKRLILWYLWGTHEIRHMASSIPPKNDRNCQLPWHCQEQRWRRWGKRPKSTPRPSCSICWKRSNQLYSSNNLLINYIKRNAFLHTWNRNGNHSMVIDSIVWAKFCRTAVFFGRNSYSPETPDARIFSNLELSHWIFYNSNQSQC